MRIQHNITAMNSYRNLSTNQTKLNKNLEKLSTGYKVNRASDDAAGLAISEKMRAQISGLEQATKNAKDGMSLIQTAEGALTEVHDMLNRMVTLAEQSANGTYDDTVDRFQLQKEVDALKEEIDRVAESTNYNGIKLLDGSLSGKGNVKGMVTVEGIDATYAKAGTTALGELGGTTDATELKENDKVTYNVAWKDSDGKDHSTTVEFKVGTDNGATKTNSALIASDGTKYKLTNAGKTDAKGTAGGDLQKAVIAELNKNTDFAANFKATSSTTTDIVVGTTPHSSGTAGDGATTEQGGITITSLKEGTAGAVVKSVELAVQKWEKDSDTYLESTAVDGSTVVGSVRATDAAQELKLDNIHILRPGDEKETDTTVADSIFEIGGKKFALYGSSNNKAIQDLKAVVGSDVTFIQVTDPATNKGAKDAKSGVDTSNFKAGGTYKASADDAKVIAGELSRVTGMNFTFDGDKIITGKGTTLQTAKGKTLMLQVGDTSDEFNRVGVNVGDMHVAALGLKDVDISDQDGAADAVSVIKNAVNIVSDTRGGLGALQNRLDHTINNLGVMRENIQSAESLIRDTDVAEEMMTFTKNNILNQSAQAMLAQANQLPQGVLQLIG